MVQPACAFDKRRRRLGIVTLSAAPNNPHHDPESPLRHKVFDCLEVLGCWSHTKGG